MVTAMYSPVASSVSRAGASILLITIPVDNFKPPFMVNLLSVKMLLAIPL
jgi:hypothetical protein